MSAMRGGGAARRTVVEGTTLGVGVVLVLALIALVNYFGFKYYQRFDWTSDAIYSLSDKSRAVLEELESDVEAVVFMSPSSQLYLPVTELLSRYEAASDRFQVRVLDPDRNPAEAQRLIEQYDVKSLNSVVLAAGENERRVIEEADLAEYDYSGMQMGQGPQIREFLGEQLFTGAILELVEARKPKILFTTGHGEAAPDDVSPRGMSQAQDLLGRDNFEIETWSSLGQTSVPADTDLVVVASPQVAFLEPELEVLTRYLVGGGRVLLLLDPVLSASGLERTGFGPWLEGYGVRLGDNLVVDPTNPLPFYSAETFFANAYVDHPITEALEDARYPVVFSLARSVGALENETDPEISVTELVRSSAAAWGETNLVELDQVEQDEGDVGGPVGLAVAVEIERAAGAGADPASVSVIDDEAAEPDATEEAGDADGAGASFEASSNSDSASASEAGAADGAAKDAPAEGGEVEGAGNEGEGAAAVREGRLVVFGDSDFASNAQLAAVGNPTLLLNAMNWLVERENLLQIPPKQAEQIQLNLTRADLSTIYLIVLVALPLASVVTGVAVYLRRRR